MNKLIIKLSLFCLPLLAIAIVADILVSKNLKQSSDFEGELEVWTDIYDSKIDAEVAIYGSSRAWVHIDPSILENSLNLNAYNFGIDGHHFAIQYLRHLEYFSNNEHPNTIILSLDVFMFEKVNDLYNREQFMPYMLWNKNMVSHTHGYNGFELLDYYVPMLRYRGEKKILSNGLLRTDNETNKYRYHGYKGRNESWNNDLKKAKLERDNITIPIDSATVELFKTFLRDMESEKVEVILVYSPEYIEGQSFTKNRDEIMSLFSTIAEEFELPFLDYSADEMSYNKDFFYNALHLNNDGATLFTQKLVQDIKEYLPK